MLDLDIRSQMYKTYSISISNLFQVAMHFMDIVMPEKIAQFDNYQSLELKLNIDIIA